MPSSHLTLPKLTEQQRKFVQSVAAGVSQTQAARLAGYKHPTVLGYQMMRQPMILEAIRIEQSKYEHSAHMSRKKVVDGLLEAVDIARTMSEPASMVAGWREIARICGYYAPEQKKIDISINGATHVAQIEQMSDEELVNVILEGESQRVEDETDSEDELPAALPAPFEDVGDEPAEPE